MFYVGQKVVCIDAAQTNSYGSVEIVEKEVYTISAIIRQVAPWAVPGTPSRHLRGVGLYLGEVPREVPFAASRFRPVVERKTDISIFTAMLNPSKVEELA